MDDFALSQQFFSVMHLTRDVLADTVKVLEITPTNRLNSRENRLVLLEQVSCDALYWFTANGEMKSHLCV